MHRMWYACALMRKEVLMNILKKKATDLTVGESLKLSVIITIALAPLAFTPYLIEKISDWNYERKSKRK
jgi:hypothetical protein